MENERIGQSSRISSPSSDVRSWPGSVAQGYAAAEKCVVDNPASAIGIAFGAGLGVGLSVGLVLKSAITERRRSHRHLAERLGRQVLDAVSTALPESVRGRIRSR